MSVIRHADHMESYYDLLDISPDATTEEIEQAYRRKLKETHPDVSDHEDASERTKRLIDAKETLTDEAERARYDRIGHDAYVGEDPTTTVQGGRSSNSSTTGQSQTGSVGSRSHGDAAGRETQRESGRGTTHRQRRNRARNRQRRAREQSNRTGDVRGERATAGRGSQRSQESRQGRAGTWNDAAYTTDGEWEDSWRTWNTGGSYAVRRGEDSLRAKGGIFSSQQALVLLGATFLVYPVLLFGALFRTFPLAVNIIVAMCAVLIVAFLQSIPNVAVVVFGVWTVLLPIVLTTVFGVSLFSLIGVLAITGVVFPLALSILTYLFIQPMSVG
ncbi:DnaJ domain-containing protein [Halovenus marina]|uniref:J domain-containing protein n=1 Tax=Halovenus marina TaxID=3396621 RepID=UPI003F570CE5